MDIMEACFSAKGAATTRNSKIRCDKLLMLEKRVGLDSIAALVILMIEAHGRNESENTFLISRYLFISLLVLFSTSFYQIIRNDVFELFKANVFPLAEHDGLKYDFEGYDFGAISAFLDQIYEIYLRANPQRITSLSHEMSLKAKLCHGHYFEFRTRCAFALPLMPIEPKCPENEMRYKECELIKLKRTWGINRTLGRADFFPPTIYDV